MGVIFMQNRLIWQRQECVYILSMIIHWKCVFQFCVNCPCINITYQETDNQYSETTPSIRFQIHHIVARCTAYGRIPLKYRVFFACVNNNIHHTNLKEHTPEKS